MSDVKRAKHSAHEEDHASLDVFLDDPLLPEGQRQRLTLFRSIESTVCARVEELCTTGEIDVTDVAVLVVDASAQDLFFSVDEPRGTMIMFGHRYEVRAFLREKLPAAEDAPFDPYDDLLEPSPRQSVRVLIMDHQCLTVMSYGTFVTVRVDPEEMPEA